MVELPRSASQRSGKRKKIGLGVPLRGPVLLFFAPRFKLPRSHAFCGWAATPGGQKNEEKFHRRARPPERPPAQASPHLVRSGWVSVAYGQ